MNGPHDMGGMQCFGTVMPETDEPVFHEEWERKALALTVGVGFAGMWNLDMSRFARESLPPEFYLSKSYYQIWIAGLEQLMLERGMVTQEELATGKLITPGVETRPAMVPEKMAAALAKGGPVEREPGKAPLFKVGDKIRSLNHNPACHTRLPRYARGRYGKVAEIHGCHVFPDSNACGDGENPQWLYSVEFEACELFGADGGTGDTVMVDCWEPYLEQA